MCSLLISDALKDAMNLHDQGHSRENFMQKFSISAGSMDGYIGCSEV